MGTNYYLRQNCCDKCGRYDETHIGKSSGGWRFALSARDIKSYGEWVKAILDAGTVWDEYGRLHTSQDLIKLIEEKKDEKSHPFFSKEDYPTWSDGPADLLNYEFC